MKCLMNNETLVNVFELPDNETFVVGQSDMSCFENYQKRTTAGAFILCRKGRARIQADSFEGTIKRHTGLFILPGTFLSFSDRTEDFQVAYFAFSQRLFSEAVFRLELELLRELKHAPMMNFPPQSAAVMWSWFKILYNSYIDRENRFRETIVRNRLQIAILEACDHIARNEKNEKHRLSSVASTRQSELFNRFSQLVLQYATQEREVSFYAEKLCISTRYLSTIVRSISHHSAKELIDHAVMMEIRQLLLTTDLSVQEIAYRMHFPDQSYLGRFFRKHTGLSPTAFRLQVR